ncbi:MAG: phosphatase PAP2 family protein [Betaproteobacteria bacterium]|nr:phosphatase PAP2 family protein [Betaproteobacteria bacterium]
MALFFSAYFHLLRHPSGPVTTMPLTPLDAWIGFQPWALPAYLSLWVYVCLPAVLMQSRRELLRFGAGIGAVCAAGLAVFHVWPTRVPPMSAYYVGHPGFDLLRGIDAAGNACPSLHVASAVFAAAWLDDMLPRLGLGRHARLASAGWCALIVYSTMAVKQHVLIDVACGALLGTAGALLVRLLVRAPALAPAGAGVDPGGL